MKQSKILKWACLCLFMMCSGIMLLALGGKYLVENVSTPVFKLKMSHQELRCLEIIAFILSCVGVYSVFFTDVLRTKSFVWFSRGSFRQKKNILLIGYALLNILVAIVLEANPGWDFARILSDLEKMFLHGELGLREYIMMYPNNLLYTCIVYPVVYFFGARMAYRIVIGINILLLVWTLSLFLDIVMRMTQKMKVTLIAGLFFIVFLPLVYYNQTFYSDTITLPFILLALKYLFDENQQLTRSKKKLVIATVILTIAILLKASIIVVVVAIGMLCLFVYRGKEKFYGLLPVVVFVSAKGLMLALVSVWSFFYPPLYDKTVSDVGYPESAWICMAQNEASRGDYNFNDADRVGTLYRENKMSKSEIDRLMKQCTVDRITQRTILGNTNFFMRKFAFSWSDPTYYSVVNLGMISAPGDKILNQELSTIQESSSVTRNNVFLEEGAIGIGHYLYLASYQNMLYLLVFILMVDAIRKRQKESDFFIFTALIVVGYTLFHLLWEARSRYVIAVCVILLAFIAITLNTKKTSTGQKGQ